MVRAIDLIAVEQPPGRLEERGGTASDRAGGTPQMLPTALADAPLPVYRSRRTNLPTTAGGGNHGTGHDDGDDQTNPSPDNGHGKP